MVRNVVIANGKHVLLNSIKLVPVHVFASSDLSVSIRVPSTHLYPKYRGEHGSIDVSSAEKINVSTGW